APVVGFPYAKARGCEIRGAATQVDARDFGVAAGGEIEVERTLDFARERLARLADGVVDLRRHRMGLRCAELVDLSLIERHAELLLDLFGDAVAGIRNLARKGGHAARHDVEARERRAD